MSSGVDQFRFDRVGEKSGAAAETAEQVVAKGLSGQFEEAINVGGTSVTVRGAVVNGVVKIGTAFK